MSCLLLFDIDGTILKFKKPTSRNIFSQMFLEIFNVKINHFSMPDFAGMTDLSIIEAIAINNSISPEIITNNINKIWDHLTQEFIQYTIPENIELMPAIEELLNQLNHTPNVSLGLLTGNFKINAYMKLKAHSLDKYFPFGAFGDDEKDRNRLPKIAINQANIYHNSNIFSNKNTIIIGDTPRDIECAKKNDVPVIAVATGNFSEDELIMHKPEYLLSNFSDINTLQKIIENYI